MAKVVRREGLPRGAELIKENVFDPMEGMATALSGNVDVSQMQAENGTFRLNLNIPYISAKYFWANPGGWFYVPFCLPPLQENWTTGPEVSPGTPIPVLTEVCFSFDQRSEPALPADAWHKKVFDSVRTSPDANYVSNINEGDLVYDRAGNLDIKLAIFEKTQHAFYTQTAGSGAGASAQIAPGAESEVFAVTLPAAQISARSGRNNPASWDGLSAPISPKKTYMFAINADNLVDSTGGSTGSNHTALVSVQVSLKFKMSLFVRDSSSGGSPNNLQNVPTASYGARTNDTISISVPTHSTVIKADAAQGVSAELGKIDDRLRHKIYGGYQDFSATYVGQHILDDAGYEVIAVPMFNNQAYGEILAKPCWLHARDNVRRYSDRAVIPITHPMTIHHVLFTHSFLTATPYNGSLYTLPPATGKVVYQVGVGVVAGQMSDSVDYTQVAYASRAADAAGSAGIVDFMDLQNQATLVKDQTRPQRWEQSIFSVPLVRGSVTGSGYDTQGAPFFVGEAARNGYNTNTRAQVGDPSSAGSNITTAAAGLEQFLEVRMRILAQGDIFNAAGAWQSYVADWANLSGYGGSWVYIIGKKHMRT